MSTHRWVTDTLLFAAPLVFLTLVFPAYSEPGPRATFQTIDLVIMTASLALRRTFPLVTGWTVVVTGLLFALTLATPHPALFTVPITVHAIAAYAKKPWGKVFLIIGLCASAIFVISVTGTIVVDSAPDVLREPEFIVFMFFLFAFCVAVVALGWTLGDLKQRRRNETERIAERNELLERERENEIRLASDAERMRIAREMHDIVAHSMSVIITQADGGRYAAKNSPEAAVNALETIAETGREALGNLRGMLGVLRDPNASAQTTPMPGLNDLGTLIDNVRAAGLDVTLDTAPNLPDLSPAAQLAVYRIVQEALTNTMKHGGPNARAQVSVRSGETGLVAEVVSTGRAEDSVAPGAGAGIQGMKERAHIHGGTLRAEPTDDGFLVHLDLPGDGS